MRLPTVTRHCVIRSSSLPKAGMVHSVSGWMRGVQVKLWDRLRTRAIPERLVFTTRRYKNPRLLLPYLYLYPKVGCLPEVLLQTLDFAILGFSLVLQISSTPCNCRKLLTRDYWVTAQYLTVTVNRDKMIISHTVVINTVIWNRKKFVWTREVESFPATDELHVNIYKLLRVRVLTTPTGVSYDFTA